MNKKFLFFCIAIITVIIILISLSKSNKSDSTQNTINTTETISSEDLTVAEKSNGNGLLNSTSDIDLKDLDGNEKKFEFTYNHQTFSATYSKDNWHIVNSYKIKNQNDITIICQALIDIHPIHSADMVLYRTAEDMAYEWLQHNLAYEILPDDNPWKKHAKDVDLDPKDQGKSMLEIYRSRTN
ncbi:MAG: hypothetical protein IJ867_02070 [Clostridia bacterium]|nr:hypothetical protein [Clostridia bacterium]